MCRLERDDYVSLKRYRLVAIRHRSILWRVSRGHDRPRRGHPWPVGSSIRRGAASTSPGWSAWRITVPPVARLVSGGGDGAARQPRVAAPRGGWVGGPPLGGRQGL